eukprot:953674-Prymnesium_polylepis.2
MTQHLSAQFANGGKSNFELGTMSEEDLARAKANRPDEATRPPPPEKVAIVSKLRVGDKQLAGGMLLRLQPRA